MTQNELMMMHTLCGELYHARESLEVARVEHNDAKALHDEIHRLEGKECELAERNAMATAANEDLKKRCSDLMSERDAARRENDCLREGLGKIVRFRDAMISMSDDDEKTRITKEIVANKFAGFAKAALAAASGESEEGGAK